PYRRKFCIETRDRRGYGDAMSGNSAGRRAGRVFAAAVLAASMTGAVSVAAAPIGAAPAVLDAAPAPAPAPAPSPAGPADEAGGWCSHGHTRGLRDAGTGALAAWPGAFDGTRSQLGLMPAPGPATAAEVTGSEQIGAGAPAPAEQPGVGSL